MQERCLICGCILHRDGEYAQPTVKGRSHATEHHYVAERFFGRSGNRRGEIRQRILARCPWNHERKTGTFCYECHEEILHNPVLLPEDVHTFGALVEARGLSEESKADSREKVAGRIKLFHDVIAAGLLALQEKEQKACRPERLP